MMKLISMGYDYNPRVERTEARRFQDHVENEKNLVCVTHLAHDVIDVIGMDHVVGGDVAVDAV